MLDCGQASPSPRTMTHKGVAMRYRGIEYSVVQGIERHLWKWVATVAGTKISGQGSTRDETIEKAKKEPLRALSKSNASSMIQSEKIAMISRPAAIVAFVIALISVSSCALAQGAPAAKKPSVRGKPFVQAKPVTPMGCKLVGSVRGTKIWAGDCVGATELRGSQPAGELSSPPPTGAPAEKD